MTDRLGPDHRGDGPPDVTCAAPTCRRRPTHGHLCGADASRLGQWLADIGDDWARLDAAPTSTSWAPDRIGHGGLAFTRSPARLDVLALSDARTARDPDTGALSVPAVLGEWADTVREARGLTVPTVVRVARHGLVIRQTTSRAPYDVTADRALLAIQLPWIVGQDWVGDFYADLRDAWAALKAATGQRTGQRPVRACPAPVGHPPAPCGGPVWLDKDAAYCGACGQAWSGFQLVRLVQGAAA